jgi:serine/threonine-protein kinase
MGEVYRATDSNLKRTVAVKVLPASVAGDVDRLARFQREAEVLAALNHPNIAAIYGLEKTADLTALVMELVDGEDLSQRIARGPIPLAEALPMAKQIADALEAAHEQGIIHRDLKPANIKVRADGTAKVLDFGLAKATDPAGTSAAGVVNSPTMTARATQMGTIIGTAAYMSPEQARGKAVDKRTDIWAFGVVLYEMLTGRRMFPGEEISDVLAAVLRDDIDWTAWPSTAPPRLRRLLERCLDRDAKARLRDIGEARVEIAKIESGGPEAERGGAATTAPSRSAARRVAPLVIATAVVAIAATLGLLRWLMPAALTGTSGAVAQLSLTLPDGDEVGATNLGSIAIARDDSRVAYVGLRDGKTQLFVRALGDRTAKALEGTVGAESPFFSPDGQWIAFFADGKLKKVAVGGASVQALAEAPFQRGGDWGGDGYLYFAPTNIGGIWRVPDAGGAATEVTHKDAAAGEISHRWPHVVADGSTLLFSDWTGPGNDEQNIAVQAIGAAAHHLLVKGGNYPRDVPTPGLLLYAHVGELVAVPWRPTQTDLGRAVPVAMPERLNDGGGNEGTGNYAISAAGTLVYIAGGRSRNARRLVWIDRAGKVEPASLPERDYESVLFAPDGNRAVVQIRDSVTDLWIYDVGRNTLAPIGNSTGSSQSPVWSADGTRVIYRGTRAGFRNVFWRPVDGSGSEERLMTKADVSDSPTSVSPDSHWLVFSENSAQESSGVGIWMMRLDGDRTPRHLFQSPAGESDGQISPDGKWIAYQAPVSSRQEVYVSPFPGPGPRRQVSTDGGTEPLWSHDGRELFFQSGTRLMGASVTIGAVFAASVPHIAHEGRFLKAINGNTDWTLTPDGKRFLRIQEVEPERPVTHIDLVLNWFAELRPLTAGK